MNLEMAEKIAQAASCMDNLQSESCIGLIYMQERMAAIQHIKNLHDIAVQLAGTRVDEIYAPDDGEPE